MVLAYNLLTVVSNTTFLGMTGLRILDLSYNYIITLDPSMFSDVSVGIYFVDVSYNRLNGLDISNVILVWENSTFKN